MVPGSDTTCQLDWYMRHVSRRKLPKLNSGFGRLARVRPRHALNQGRAYRTLANAMAFG